LDEAEHPKISAPVFVLSRDIPSIVCDADFRSGARVKHASRGQQFGFERLLV